MFRFSNFDKHLENATSNLHLEPDWPSILLISDAIRQNEVTPKYALQAIKKKMLSPNPHSAMYALLVLESVVKNCGSPIHEEITSKANCEMFTSLINTTTHENVRNKLLELIQTWAYAFRSSYKYRSIKDTMMILKSAGHTFPELKEADAMFTSDTAPNWVDGTVCHRCRVTFSMTVRKHHCRNCGQVFCAACSSKNCTLPKFGIEKQVRVCEACYVYLQKPVSGKVAGSGKAGETDLPAEYLTSSLAQQTQTPPRRTEQELQEEEELQLAIALSQSEAEHKTKPLSAITRQMPPRSPSPEPLKRSPSPADDMNSASDPELAKYLNRGYWEQRKTTDSPASPSAPSPMQSVTMTPVKISSSFDFQIFPEDQEIDDFAGAMKSQVEIFVNRMKSNSSRGRSISTDSSVQTLFLNLTSLHSKLLSYIKEMDDKRMWYEQLQDKLTQIKDSRAALDVLRQEHQEKLRRIAEEQERQRQLQMAHKLEIMRKKKQEYLQYQRQLALQRIQEQEREMQMRQEQQKAQYRMGTPNFPYMSPPTHGSPVHQMGGGVPSQYNNYQYGRFPTNPQQQQQQMSQQMGMGQMQSMYPPGSMPGNQMQPNLSQQQGGQPNMQQQQQPQPGMLPQSGQGPQLQMQHGQGPNMPSHLMNNMSPPHQHHQQPQQGQPLQGPQQMQNPRGPPAGNIMSPPGGMPGQYMGGVMIGPQGQTHIPPPGSLTMPGSQMPPQQPVSMMPQQQQQQPQGMIPQQPQQQLQQPQAQPPPIQQQQQPQQQQQQQQPQTIPVPTVMPPQQQNQNPQPPPNISDANTVKDVQTEELISFD